MKANMKLARSRNLSNEAINELNRLYEKLENIFESQKRILNNNLEINKDLLEKWDKEVREIEFRIQELWGFEKNSNWHHYWFEQPLCTCPKIDNYERLGTGMSIINESCLIHGEKN